MKIKVKPEGRENIWLADKDSLKKWIKSKKFEMIHNFTPSGNMIIGADHEIDSVLKDIDNADRLAIFTGPNANMGHARAIITNEKLECYDIGTITKKDLLTN